MGKRVVRALAYPDMSFGNAQKHIESIQAGEVTEIQLSGASITPIMWAVIDAATTRELPIYSILSDEAHQQLKETMPGILLHRGAQ